MTSGPPSSQNPTSVTGGAGWRRVRRVARPVGLLVLAGLLGQAGFISLVLGGWGCAEQFCGDDLGALLEGYVAGTLMTAVAAACVVGAWIWRPRWLLLAGLAGLVVAAFFVLYLEGVL